MPAKHPLTLLIGVVLGPLGAGAALLAYGAISIACLVALGYAAYRFGSALGGTAAGAITAVIVLTRPETIAQVAETGKDLPFVALVLLAGAIAIGEGNTRPAPVLGLLAVAGLIRPEAWVLAGAFWLWLAYDSREEAFTAVPLLLLAAAPVGWLAMDLVLTGDPLHTLDHGRDKSDALKAAGFAPEHGSGAGSSKLERLRSGLDHGIPRQIGWGVVAAAAILLGGRLIAALRSTHEPDLPPAALAIPLALAVVAIAGSAAAVAAGLGVQGRFVLLGAFALVAIAASSVAGAGRSFAATIAIVLTLGGTLALAPGDVGDARDQFAQREHLGALSDNLLELSEAEAVTAAVADCPELAAGGDRRAKVTLARALVALSLGRDVGAIELGRAQLLRYRGSAFAFGYGPEHPAFGRDLDPDERAVTAERAGPWTFASRC